MNEAEMRAELVDPLLQKCGWGKVPDSEVLTMSKVLEKNKKLLGDAVLNLLDIVDEDKIINRIGEEKIIELIR